MVCCYQTKCSVYPSYEHFCAAFVMYVWNNVVIEGLHIFEQWFLETSGCDHASWNIIGISHTSSKHSIFAIITTHYNVMNT
jgi:hypothetical protein